MIGGPTPEAEEWSPRLQRGFAEGFWGDNWAAIKCSQSSCCCLSPVTCHCRTCVQSFCRPSEGVGTPMPPAFVLVLY